MANPEHVRLVKQGAAAIRAWRSVNPEAQLDLRLANFEDAELADLDLSFANLVGANFSRANLPKVRLHHANLQGARLVGANVSPLAALGRANFSDASLSGANLTYAQLGEAKLVRATLVGADLRGAWLLHTNLQGAQMRGARIAGAKCGSTVWAGLDLSNVPDLEHVEHRGPSTVGLDTLAMSHGQIPESFLRGCGLRDWEIVAARLHRPDLSREETDQILYQIGALRTATPTQISPLFISYSHADTAFVDALEVKLNEKGIRFWRDIHYLTSGRVEKQLMHALSMNPTILLVLSNGSVNSDWVEWEASKARELEKELKRDVLCPVALDDAWERSAWAGPLRRQIEDYHVLDLSGWRDDAVFQRQFDRLIKGLRDLYQADTSP